MQSFKASNLVFGSYRRESSSTTMAPSNSASPARSPPPILRSPPPTEAPKESAISRLLITPITFVSFLVSLALIDSQNHSLRTHNHSSPHSPPTTLFGKLKSFTHSCVYKPASPYAYIQSPSLKGANEVEHPKQEREEKWYWHNNQRNMMKAEFADAFKIRKWVMVALILLSFGGLLGAVLLGRWIWGVFGFSLLGFLGGNGITDSLANGEAVNSLGKDW